MINKPTDNIKDNIVRNHIDHLQQEAQGNILILSAAPNATVPLLQDFETGQYGNDLFFRVGSYIYKVTADAVITIT